MLIPFLIFPNEVQLPKRIKLRTSDELHQAISDIASALKTLDNISVQVAITLDATPVFLSTICLVVITGLIILRH